MNCYSVFNGQSQYLYSLYQTFRKLSIVPFKKSQKMANPCWIDHFLLEPESQLFVSISSDFLSKYMSKPEIIEKFPNIDDIGKLILSNISSGEKTDADARELYLLAHSAYLETDEGISKMYEKCQSECLMKCPRLFCNETICYPCQAPGQNNADSTVKMYCPNCKEIYNIENEVLKNVSGKAFAQNYIKLLLELYPELNLEKEECEYVPRIYGFKLFKEEGTSESD